MITITPQTNIVHVANTASRITVTQAPLQCVITQNIARIAVAQTIDRFTVLNIGIKGDKGDKGDTGTAPLKRSIIALTDATNIALDLSLGTYFRVVLGGNRTLSNPTNLPTTDQRQVFIVEVVQDAGGNHTLSFDTNYQTGDIDTTLSPTANSITFLVMIATNSGIEIVDAKGNYT